MLGVMYAKVHQWLTKDIHNMCEALPFAVLILHIHGLELGMYTVFLKVEHKVGLERYVMHIMYHVIDIKCVKIPVGL